MSEPMLIPPLTPGVLDVGIPYTIVIASRNTDVIEVTGISSLDANPNGGLGAPGMGLAWLGLSSGGLGTEGVPGDRVVSGKVICSEVFTTATGLYTITLESASGAALGTQNVVVRGMTAVSKALAYTIGSPVFTLEAHGLAVGDRVGLSADSNIGRPSLDLSAPMLVTAATASTFTLGVIPGQVNHLDFTNHGEAGLYFYWLSAQQQGRTQWDINSAASATVAHNASFSYTITSDGTGSFSASGLPAGLTLSGATITGHPTQWGYFPVTLSIGTMKRYLILTVTPVLGDSLLVAAPNIDGEFGGAAVHSTSVVNATTLGIGPT